MKVVTENKSLRQQAQEELIAERLVEAKKALKSKYKALNDATIIVKNLEREITDLEEELEQELNDISGR